MEAVSDVFTKTGSVIGAPDYSSSLLDGSLFSDVLSNKMDKDVLSIGRMDGDSGSDDNDNNNSDFDATAFSGYQLLSAMSPILSMNYNTSSSGDASSAAVTAANAAVSRVGDPYSQSKRGQGDYVDCSYLTQWAYKQAGISLPGTAATQAKYCIDTDCVIDESQLKKGDLVFWTKSGCGCGRYDEVHHVGMYLGNGKVVEASYRAGEVVVRDLWGTDGSGKWQVVMYGRPSK